MKFALSEQNLLFVIPSSIPHQQVMQPFLVSSDTNFFYHPSTYSTCLEALVSWPNGFSSISSTACWFMWSIGVILTFFDDLKTFLTLVACWQCSISDTIDWSQFFMKLPNLLFLFLIYPNILCINPDISQRWCNEPVCRHCWCRCWC